MTKQEVIREAYGEHFEKCNPDENGWTDYRVVMTHPSKIFKSWETKEQYWFRPRQLEGLEANNGWIKIESESDLPKVDGNYHVIDKFMKKNPCFETWNNEAIYPLNERWLHRFTHYQLEIKPKQPIY